MFALLIDVKANDKPSYSNTPELLTDYLEYPKDKAEINRIIESNKHKKNYQVKDSGIMTMNEYKEYFSNKPSESAVVFEDDRKLVDEKLTKTKFNNIVQLYSKYTVPQGNEKELRHYSKCSGIIISQDAVLTAAHCIFTNDKPTDDKTDADVIESAKNDIIYDNLLIIPANNGGDPPNENVMPEKSDKYPFGSWSTNHFYISKSYIDWGKSIYSRDSYDWAIVKINGKFPKELVHNVKLTKIDDDYIKVLNSEII